MSPLLLGALRRLQNVTTSPPAFSRRVQLDFFLVRDEKSGFKYPLYVPSGRGQIKDTTAALTYAKRARIRGKFKLYVQ
jgi:hypothetical protein